MTSQTEPDPGAGGRAPDPAGRGAREPLEPLPGCGDALGVQPLVDVGRPELELRDVSRVDAGADLEEVGQPLDRDVRHSESRAISAVGMRGMMVQGSLGAERSQHSCWRSSGCSRCPGVGNEHRQRVPAIEHLVAARDEDREGAGAERIGGNGRHTPSRGLSSPARQRVDEPDEASRVTTTSRRSAAGQPRDRVRTACSRDPRRRRGELRVAMACTNRPLRKSGSNGSRTAGQAPPAAHVGQVARDANMAARPVEISTLTGSCVGAQLTRPGRVTADQQQVKPAVVRPDRLGGRVGVAAGGDRPTRQAPA